MTGYRDNRIWCTDDEIVIRHYYAPLGTKRVKYSAIREVRQVPLSAMGRVRISGSGDLTHWFNFDPSRPRKKTALILHTDARIRPVLTPDDPEGLAADLKARGLNVTTGTEVAF
jgi:hypothetical protein